jgi:hypothetical protein
MRYTTTKIKEEMLLQSKFENVTFFVED